MKRILSIAIAICATGLLLAGDCYAHGGSFRGPVGGVPPGLREPSDPDPPPPPPSDPGDPGGPTTPGDPGPGTPTPPDSGHDTPSDAPPPTPTGPTAGPQRKASTASLTFESWRFWWAYNNDDILNLKSHIYSARTSSSSPIFFASKKDAENRRSAQRPTERAIVRTIIPALMRSLNRKGDHEDIHGGALVALGKIGTAEYISLFSDALHNRFKTEKGQRIDFGYQATESAVLALGLLPELEEKDLDTIRGICLDAISDEKLRRRDRSWAAVVLGLQRDKKAVRPLWALLEKKYENDNIPAGILCGLGLIGDDSILPELQEAFLSGKLQGRDASDPIRAFIGYAISKIGNPEALDTVLKVLGSRRYGRVVKRSAAIAAGVLGAKANDEKKKDTVRALQKYIRKSGGDASGENFAIIALSQIGTEPALEYLLKMAEDGKYGQRPFAGLGLATRIWYQDQEKENKEGPGMDDAMRTKIVEKFRKLYDKFKDADTRAAFALCRGLVRDQTAISVLARAAAKKSGNPVMRGFACVSLGLIGQSSDEVKDAMKLALAERKSSDLRRDAATGLGLLRDAEVVKILLDELKKAKSFAVQGQLIQAIGTIGDHTAIDPLVNILDDKGQPAQTRAMAAVGLGMIGDLRELPKLARLSKNYNYRASVEDLNELLFIL